MDFSDPPRHRPAENLLPMINVVFLLLVFFLIASTLAPPEPFPVSPPEAEAGAEAEGVFTLHLAADGALGFHDATGGEAVFAALAAARTDHCAQTDCVAAPPRLMLRVDAALPAARLAAMLPRLGGMGFARVDLITVRP